MSGRKVAAVVCNCAGSFIGCIATYILVLLVLSPGGLRSFWAYLLPKFFQVPLYSFLVAYICLSIFV